MGIIKDVRKYFSNLPLTAVRGNIISSKGASISPTGEYKHSLISIYDDTYLPTYMQRLEELGKYYSTPFVQGVLKVLSTPMLSSMKDDMITIVATEKGEVAGLNRVLEAFNELGVKSLISDNLYQLIYYGSYSLSLKEAKGEDKFKFRKLVFPQVNISLEYLDASSEDKIDYTLISSRNGHLHKASDPICRIGLSDLDLYWGGYISSDTDVVKLIKIAEDDAVYDDLSLKTATPLFYMLIDKLKQYIFRDKLAEILTLRELLLPTVFTMSASDVDQASATELSQKIENLCNAAADSSLLIANSSDIQQLYTALMSKVKIIPDFQSVMQNNLAEFDPAKLSDKLKDLIESLPAQKESLLVALGIPVDLFEGKTTRWDTDKSAERLNKLIKSYKDAINSSIKDLFCKLYFAMEGKEISSDLLFECDLFESDTNTYFDETQSNTILIEYIESLEKLIGSSPAMAEIIDQNEYELFIKNALINYGYKSLIKKQ